MSGYFAVLSVEFVWANASPWAYTKTGVFIAGTTRDVIFKTLLTELEDEMPQVSDQMRVTFFAVEPNTLGGNQ